MATARALDLLVEHILFEKRVLVRSPRWNTDFRIRIRWFSSSLTGPQNIAAHLGGGRNGVSSLTLLANRGLKGASPIQQFVEICFTGQSFDGGDRNFGHSLAKQQRRLSGNGILQPMCDADRGGRGGTEQQNAELRGRNPRYDIIGPNEALQGVGDMELDSFNGASDPLRFEHVVAVDLQQDKGKCIVLALGAAEFLHGPDLQPSPVAKPGDGIDILQALDLQAIFADFVICLLRFRYQIIGDACTTGRGGAVACKDPARSLHLPKQPGQGTHGSGQRDRGGRSEAEGQPWRQGCSKSQSRTGCDDASRDAGRQDPTPDFEAGHSVVFVACSVLGRGGCHRSLLGGSRNVYRPQDP